MYEAKRICEFKLKEVQSKEPTDQNRYSSICNRQYQRTQNAFMNILYSGLKVVFYYSILRDE